MKAFMRRAGTKLQLRAVILSLVVATTVMAPRPANADSRTTFLAERLKADDFRVRANAALALGQTSDDDAVQPLCGALGDGNEVVRSSAAAALKRLGKSAAVACLKARLSVESSDDVKLQLSRAIESLGTGTTGTGGGLDDPPKQIAGAKYYVSIGPITNNSGRPQAEIDRVVGAAIKAKLEALGYQVAPRIETPDAARKVIGDRHMTKGFYLSVVVQPFNTSSGISVTMQMSIASYPGKSIVANVPSSAGAGGAKAGDHGTEDGLMAAVGQNLIATFDKNVKDL
ncbi:hypothetical protein BH09MYX1_BH09MYX1_28020 [soil metagenome]